MNQKIVRALISVTDKTGIVEFANGLASHGVELLSTGGTAKALRDAGLSVKDVSEFTGFPEMLDGRVKTLHPKVHAGLLYQRGNDVHEATMTEHGLESIDLVCVNLYAFEETVAKPGVTLDEAIENIDIGGPTMLRSAAKNMKHVTIVCDPADYDAVLSEMSKHDGATTESTRLRLGQKVFAKVAAYNTAIANYLEGVSGRDARSPFIWASAEQESLRYGENPHQAAVLYRERAPDEPAIAHVEQLHGKAMSYNNYLDGDGALEAVKELSGVPAVSVIKHSNPCGYATGATLAEAFEAAWQGDPVSAFGSVIAVTQPVDLATAELMKGRFVEAVIAPDFEPDALEYLKGKSSQLRLLKTHVPMQKAEAGRAIRQIGGGLLVQDRDVLDWDKWEAPTKAQFPENKRLLAEFGVKCCKHVKSNAIVLVTEYKPGCYAQLGMGAGQPNRVDALRKLSLTKANENMELAGREGDASVFSSASLSECVLISDAFFPFADTIEFAAEAGIKYVVQPGGSKRDNEVIAACDNHGMAMVCTGMRHFRH